jgi:tetratricopeptide (TPR) repeat protein
MNYDLVIIKLTKPHLKQVIAHQLAADPSISLQKALSLLDNLPIIYMKELSIKELEEATYQLNKLGVVCRAVESENPIDKLGKREIPEEESAKVSVEQIDTQKAPEFKQERPSVGRVFKRVMFSSSGARVKPVEKEKPKEKKKNTLANILLAGGIIVGVIIIFIIGKNKTFKIQSIRPLVSKTDKGQSKKKPGRTSRKNFSKDHKEQKESEKKKQKPVAPSQIKSSELHIDSAAQSGNDYERAIKFYKIAISFNQYNLKAWQGLLATYRSALMRKEAEETEKRMAELFSENVFSIEKIVEPYGVLTNYVRDANGICRIEYRSQSTKRHKLEKETYFLIRALTAQENCISVSLYASTGKGKGMLVRISTDVFPSKLSDYIKRASISFIE